MGTRYARLRMYAAAAVITLLGTFGLAMPAADAAPGQNLAAGKPTTASSANGPYGPANITDGNQDSYWESSGTTMPQWAQVDLGSKTSVDQVVLKLPGSWEQRVQTLSVQSSTDGATFTDRAGSARYVFDPASSNVVTIDFDAVSARYIRIKITANTGWPAAQISELEVRAPDGTTPADLAKGKELKASSSKSPHTANQANDGDQGSYWESTNGDLPQWIQVDLGAERKVNKTVLKLPPGWGARTQTLTVQNSNDGSNFSQLVASAGYDFNPAQANTVTINFTEATTRYLRLLITGNTGWPAGQLSEWEVYGPATDVDTKPPSAPGDLAFTEPEPGKIKLTWDASTDNVGVTGYDVYANGTLRASVGKVLTYTDNQPASATVSYYVVATDAAGNTSDPSNTVTRKGTSTGTNLALGKAISANGSAFTFVPTNANDGNLSTYWEGAAGYPNTITVDLRAKADVTKVNVKLNPGSAWGARKQTIEVLGRAGGSGAFTRLAEPKEYQFDPATENSISIPVTGLVSQVQLKYTSNTGAPAGQAAEFEVIGTPAPAPDLTLTDLSWDPPEPSETDPVTLKATVKNTGTDGSPASDVSFYLSGKKVGTAPVDALAAGGSAVATLKIGVRDAATYPLAAKVDEADLVTELNEMNNSLDSDSPLVVKPVPSSDLVAVGVGWNPGNPSKGDTVAFTAAIKNQGTIASASGSHGITMQILDGSNVVKTFTGSVSGTLAAGQTSAAVNLGTWTAANGRYTVKVVLEDDANEVEAKRANNTSTRPFFVGRGANLPFDMYEAEDGMLAGGAQTVSFDRATEDPIGHLGGEASGRKAVKLNSTGAGVEFTARADTNTLVARYSIPDGTTSSVNVYVNGTLLKALPLTSRYMWVYGDEAGPGNTPGPNPRHVYDEANIVLGKTVPKGAKIKLQKDEANPGNIAIDFINLEQATAIPNPDPAKYAVPAGFTQQDVQNALDKVRQDPNLTGVYLPPGDYPTQNKFQVFGKAMKVVGAGPWFTRFVTPQDGNGTDAGFAANSTANGSTFSGFSFFGNYTIRQDGPGKVFDFSNVSNMTVDNIWTEHMVCMFWGTNVDNTTIKNSRIRNIWADGVNLTNGSSDNTLSNIEARTTGDDSFALFPAIDNHNEQQTGNVYENLTALLTWRAAGLAVYGGGDNHFRNLYIADTLTYPGVTVGSLKFGSINALGFEADPKTTFENISLVRDGGHFWGKQAFPALWIFSAEYDFQGLRFSDIDIVDPVYTGIMFQTKWNGSQPLKPIKDTVFTNVTISGAQKVSNPDFAPKSGFALWANPEPEPGQGPPTGSVIFNNLKLFNNFVDIQNTTSTFTITRNP